MIVALTMAERSGGLVYVGALKELKLKGCVVVSGAGHDVAVFHHNGNGRVYAVENRCPHMGFPLSRGTVKDGILTCDWHHARFDLKSGGTFDPWADDARVFPVVIRDNGVWVDLGVSVDLRSHHSQRLRDGLERNIRLLTAKAVLALLSAGEESAEPFRIGLDFGIRYRQDGWGQGLTMLTCMMNLLQHLDIEDRPIALYHGLSAVAQDCAGTPPRFGLRRVPGATAELATLKRWFRQFVEVRDAEGAERCLVSAIHVATDTRQIADMLFAAATDHRYLDTGHVLDFTNKALEALDVAGWEFAEPVLASLVSRYAQAERMEEASAWRNPVDVIAILEKVFEALPTALRSGLNQRGNWRGRETLVPMLLGDDPVKITEALLEALRDGAPEEELAEIVAYAGALRIARFPISNEFTDWDTALHTFTFANAVHQAARRSPSMELLRGVFDAAMSVYLDRFLNVPPVPLPAMTDHEDPEALLNGFPPLLNHQQQVNEAGRLVARYLGSGGNPDLLLATLGKVLLREDRDFHTIQMMEAAFRQYSLLRGKPDDSHVLMAAARYLAAHAPTVRAQGQTYNIAWRLHRGERVYEEGFSSYSLL